MMKAGSSTPKGNLKDWWTEKDAAEFEKRVNCIRDQYAQYTVVDDIKINSKLTSGEDVADLGGELLAWMAWKTATKGKHLEPVDGLDAGAAVLRGVCAVGVRRRASGESCACTRSPIRIRRTNTGSTAWCRTCRSFGRRFVQGGQPMVREKACKVW